MFSTIINDCRDDNARGRQTSRLGSLLETSISFIGAQSDLEAGVQLIDVLDATAGARGLILVNVAPRGGHTSKWENGTPFAYFYHGETLIISTVDGYALSAVKQLGLISEVQLLDTHTATDTMLKAGFISAEHARRLPKSQFRSFDFIPYAGAFLLSGRDLPATSYSLEEIPALPPAVWFIDNFGNCKTTLTKASLNDNAELKTRFGTLPFTEQLRNVPDNRPSVIVGSSGYGDTRWLELVIQRSPFASAHHVNVGDDLFTERSHLRTATSLEND
jgi:hypothetical protein